MKHKKELINKKIKIKLQKIRQMKLKLKQIKLLIPYKTITKIFNGIIKSLMKKIKN